MKRKINDKLIDKLDLTKQSTLFLTIPQCCNIQFKCEIEHSTNAGNEIYRAYLTATTSADITLFPRTNISSPDNYNDAVDALRIHIRSVIAEAPLRLAGKVILDSIHHMNQIRAHLRRNHDLIYAVSALPLEQYQEVASRLAEAVVAAGVYQREFSEYLENANNNILALKEKEKVQE